MAHAAASAAAASLRRWARGVILGSSVDVHPSRRASGVFLSISRVRFTDEPRRESEVLRPNRGHQKVAYTRPEFTLTTEGL